MFAAKIYGISAVGFGGLVSAANIYNCLRDIKLIPPPHIWDMPDILIMSSTIIAGSLVKGLTYTALFPITSVFTGRRVYKYYISGDKEWLCPVYDLFGSFFKEDKYNDWASLFSSRDIEN
jgi:hypothetical protein